jgi:hypothetical protein
MKVRKKDYYFFDEREEIEVIAWQDLEDGDPQKLEISRRFRRKKILIKVVVIVTALIFLSSVVHFCVNRLNSTRNETSKSESEVGVSIGNRENEDGHINVGNNKENANSDSNDNNDDPGFPERYPDLNDPKFPQHQGTIPQSEMAETNTIVERGEIIVLYPSESLDPGQFRYSLNGLFKVGLTEGDVDLVLMKVEQSSEAVIWSASMDLNSNWYSTDKARCFMQSDGNLVLRDSETRKSIWMTRTHGNLQAHLVLDNSGRVAIKSGDESRTILWMDGIPRDRYTGQSSEDMTFPIRGAFYYP